MSEFYNEHYMILVFDQYLFLQNYYRVIEKGITVDEVIVPDDNWGLIHYIKNSYDGKICVLSKEKIKEFLMNFHNGAGMIIEEEHYSSFIESILEKIDVSVSARLEIVENGISRHYNSADVLFEKLPAPVVFSQVIIFVLSTNKYDCSELTCYTILRVLEQNGKKVQTIELSLISGLLKDIVGMPLSEKIRVLRCRLKQELEESSAEVAIVPFSIDIGSWNEKDYSNNSEFTYILRHVIEPDFCVLCVPVNAVTDGWLSNNYDSLMFLSGYKIDCYSIGTYFIDETLEKRSKVINCCEDDIEYCINMQPNPNIFLYNNGLMFKNCIEQKLGIKNDII